MQGRSLPDDDAAEGSTNHVFLRPTEVEDDGQNVQVQGERISGAQRKKQAREEKKKRRGQNKGRRFQKIRDELDLCWKVAAGETCEFGSEYVQRVLGLYLAEGGPDADSHMMSRGTFPPNLETSGSQLFLASLTDLPL